MGKNYNKLLIQQYSVPLLSNTCHIHNLFLSFGLPWPPTVTKRCSEFLGWHWQARWPMIIIGTLVANGRSPNARNKMEFSAVRLMILYYNAPQSNEARYQRLCQKASLVPFIVWANSMRPPQSGWIFIRNSSIWKQVNIPRSFSHLKPYLSTFNKLLIINYIGHLIVITFQGPKSQISVFFGTSVMGVVSTHASRVEYRVCVNLTSQMSGYLLLNTFCKVKLWARSGVTPLLKVSRRFQAGYQSLLLWLSGAHRYQKNTV